MNKILTLPFRMLLIVAFFALSFVAYAEKTVADLTGKDMEQYDKFRYLLMKGSPAEFYDYTEKYGRDLKEKGYMMLYYKLLSNKGFFALRHNQVFRAIQFAEALDKEVRNDKATEYYYLATGLYGDIYSSSHDMTRGEKYFMQALQEVGDADVKFTMRVYLRLAEMLCLKEPQKALQWVEKSITTSKRADNTDYLSMSLAMKAYIYFIMGKQLEFSQAYLAYLELRNMGKADFNHRYDNILEVASLAFDKRYDAAISKISDGNLAVDSLLAVARVYALQGNVERGFEVMKKRYIELDSVYSAIQDVNFNQMAAETSLIRSREEAKASKSKVKQLTNWLIGLTVVFLFVYVMGRRRLMKKIWAQNEELKTALARAEESDRMKSVFIKSMSHEVRTPLNAVAGFAQVICSSDYYLSDSEKRDMQARISNNVDQIANIINDLLELSKTESEYLVEECDKTDVWVNIIGRAVVKEVEGRQNTDTELRFETELADDFKILTNSYRLKNALKHLVDNAVKFTKQGYVELRCECKDGHVLFIVTDTGCGIKKEDQERIFEVFQKGDDFKVGVGLGLPISRRLINSLGGDVTLDTSYTEGARFIISIPSGA